MLKRTGFLSCSCRARGRGGCRRTLDGGTRQPRQSTLEKPERAGKDEGCSQCSRVVSGEAGFPRCQRELCRPLRLLARSAFSCVGETDGVRGGPAVADRQRAAVLLQSSPAAATAWLPTFRDTPPPPALVGLRGQVCSTRSPGRPGLLTESKAAQPRGRGWPPPLPVNPPPSRLGGGPCLLCLRL